jgi:prepilin peptidase CpaA
MVLQILLVAVLPAIFIAAAAWDLATFTIPNVFPAALVVLFLVVAGVAAFTSSTFGVADIGWHFAAFGVGLTAGIAFFALGWIGGGDAKLFAAICLWLGWDLLLQYTLYAALFGGVLTIGILTLRTVPLPAALHGHAWLLKLADKRSGIPYGVALAAAALFVWSSSDLFRLAAAS